MSTTPPHTPGPSSDPAAAPAATTPKKASPRKRTPSPKKTPSPKQNTTSAPLDSPGSPSRPSPKTFNPALKQAALALKMRGMAVNKIAEQLGVNYKTVWNYLDRTAKAKDKLGPNGSPPEQMSDADKKEAAISLKISGMAVKDIATTLDMNYKTIWNYLDRVQKAAGLPTVTQDPEL